MYYKTNLSSFFLLTLIFIGSREILYFKVNKIKLYNFRIETSRYFRNTLIFYSKIFILFGLSKIQRCYSLPPSSNTENVPRRSFVDLNSTTYASNPVLISSSFNHPSHSFRVSRRRQIRNMCARRIFRRCHVYVALEFETNSRSYSGVARYVTRRRFRLVKPSFGDPRRYRQTSPARSEDGK